MKISLIILTLVAGLSVGTLQAATVYNASPGTVITTAANWSNLLPVVGTNVGSIALDGSFGAGISSWEVNQTAGSVTTNSNRSFGATDAASLGTIWNLSGGSLNFGANNILRGTVGSNYAYQINVSGTGSLTAGTIQLSSGAFINVSGGSVSITQLTGGAGSLTLTGGSTSIGTLNMTAGSSNLTFGLGTSSLAVTTAFNQDGDTNINFLTSSGGSLTITGFSVTDYSTMWGNGRLNFNSSNVGTFGDIFAVTGSTLTLVPEPTTWVLLAGGLTTLMAFRRRRSF